ncbi:MAG TPA: adenylate/guanylate cyclase domain-containing protein [Candidatus Limnocylindrales bacterium]
MTAPPPITSGTFTFLFSDIEGSTRLEQQVGTARYGQLRERHREILREAFRANDGIEQGTEGDSFFVVFPSARAAVAAAVAAQRGLAAEPWPQDGTIRVRIGLHSGEAELAGESLVGLDINRAARIAAVGHGGQILLSEATRALAQGHLPDDIRLKDLGAYRLKDLLGPEHVVQVDADALPSEFPPLRTPDARPNNLPTQLTTFVGRTAEIDEAARLLSATRLLTLTGPGGTGKTRLSLQLAATVADAFPDGVFFVPLEPIRDPMLVASRIAMVVGVAETGARPIADTLSDWLRERTLLLVLDNFEQVAAAAPLVADLLRAAPGLKIVVTSRAALHVSGEQEYPVPGLPTPPDLATLSGLDRLQLPAGSRVLDAAALGQFAAVSLFIERAVAVRPGFTVTNANAPAVAAISARLHGMPLAIELAAARVKLLSPDAILARLEHQLDVLAAGARDLPARQQTLRGAIAWSYELLDEDAGRLLDRLSVFAGSCDLEAAEAVCGPATEIGGEMLDGLMALADQSLLRVEETGDGEPRFRLFDTIREFAAERLAERGETETIRDRHRDWYLALAERAASEIAGADQRRWLDRLELEHDDIRAVLDRSIDRSDPATAIRLGFAMWRFWQKRGHLAEARRRLVAMEAAPWSRDDPRLRARLVEALGGICWWQGDIPAMTVQYREALEIWLSLGDEAEIANAYYNASFVCAVPPTVDGPETDPDGLGLGYIEEARRRFHQLSDLRGEANALWALGNYHYFRNQHASGVAEFREALDMFRRTQDLTMEAWALHMLGSGLLRTGNVDEARQHIQHAIRHFHAAGDASGLTLTLDDMSALAVADGDLERAARLRGAARNLTTETGTGLATYVEDSFEAGVRPGVRSHMAKADLERLGAEGAAMALDQAIAYALEGSEPLVPHADESG